LIFVFSFLSSMVFALPPSASATINYVQAGEIVINLYTDYYYPPQHFVVKLDDDKLDEFLSTETYHSYTVNVTPGEHTMYVLWNGPNWHGIAYEKKLLVRDDFYTKIEVRDLIESKLSNYYNKTEIDEITDEILSMFDNYYPKDAIDSMIDHIEDSHYTKDKIDDILNDVRDEFNNETSDIKSYIYEHEQTWSKDRTIGISTFLRWVKEKAEEIYNAIYNFIYRDFVPREKYNHDINDLSQRIEILERTIRDMNRDIYYKNCVEIMIQNNMSKIKCGSRTYVTLEDGSIVGIEPISIG